MDLHAGDSAVSHPSIADLPSVPKGLEQLPEQPLAALRVGQVEPEVMRVKGKATTRPEDPKRLRQRGAPGGPAANHAEGAEHRKRVGEAPIREAAQIAKIGADPGEAQSFPFGLRAEDPQQGRRQLDGRHGEPFAREVEGVPPRAAAEIDERPGLGESGGKGVSVGREEGVAGEEGVLILGDPRIVGVAPE